MCGRLSELRSKHRETDQHLGEVDRLLHEGAVQGDGLRAYLPRAGGRRPELPSPVRHTYASSIGEYPMAVIRDIDRTGRPQIAWPRAIYS